MSYQPNEELQRELDRHRARVAELKGLAYHDMLAALTREELEREAKVQKRDIIALQREIERLTPHTEMLQAKLDICVRTLEKLSHLSVSKTALNHVRDWKPNPCLPERT